MYFIYSLKSAGYIGRVICVNGKIYYFCGEFSKNEFLGGLWFPILLDRGND